jgi:hypothetical protein
MFVFDFKIVFVKTLKMAPILVRRVSCENNFDSKQPKLEPKLVSKLSETRRLFRLFRFNIETRSFGVSIEPNKTKTTETNRKKC